MAILTNGSAQNAPAKPVELKASKLKVTLSETLKQVPPAESLVFGQTMTDHMIIANFDPVNGWSAPELKPYGPLTLDPASSCFQYSTNVFEGMKAYIGPDGEPRLFRPKLNMARMQRSAGRVALPPFDTDELLKLIKKLVSVEKRWIPNVKGYSLYVRPTIIGTRPSLGVAASDHATLYVICSPTGPYFRTGPRPVSLLAVGEHVRSWPGGTGGYKLALNYAPTFMPQQLAAKMGYEQCLWLLGEDKHITEVGAMNVFVVIKRDDGDLDVITPPLDGTILPGVTRDSTIALVNAHPERMVLPNLPSTLKLHVREDVIPMQQLVDWSEQGRLLEAFGVGTAAVVAGIGRIGFEGKDIVLPEHEGGRGPVGSAIYERIVEIQEGRFEFEDWSEKCE
ncbi:branched-chain amino acid aminotransferase II [Panus rudis PR-1116 ss-1]|nr:branched-chain amino acid aminotransferase II [Panus rudis PR-1116 ss-1]